MSVQIKHSVATTSRDASCFSVRIRCQEKTACAKMNSKRAILRHETELLKCCKIYRHIVTIYLKGEIGLVEVFAKSTKFRTLKENYFSHFNKNTCISHYL